VAVVAVAAPLLAMSMRDRGRAGGRSSLQEAHAGRGSAPAAPEPAPATSAAHQPQTVAPAGAGSSGSVQAARVVVSPAGIVLPVLARDPRGWAVMTPCGNRAVLPAGTPLTTATVVLDAGHGGTEHGVVGPNGLTEAALNLAVAQQAKAALEGAGVPVVLTRAADYRMTLDSRAHVALALRARAFVSIHHNSEPETERTEPGTETYYQMASSDSKRLAGLVYEEVVRALSAYRLRWVGRVDAGAKYRRGGSGDDYYGILRLSHGVPAALAELAYLTDPPEADLLARPEVQATEGRAVARAVMRYLTSTDGGSGYVTPLPRTQPAGDGGGPRGCTDPPL